MDLEVQNCFHSPLFFIRNKDLLVDLKKYIYKQNVKGIESKCAIFLKENLVESKFDFFNNDNEIVVKTRTFIAECLAALINKLHSETCSYRISFNESWFHIGKKNSVHEVHQHPNCSWCGIYFIQAGDKNSGKTTFCTPINTNYMDKGNRYLNTQMRYRVEPEDGLLILFPSYLQHYQALYKGKKDRIVVAFNVAIHD